MMTGKNMGFKLRFKWLITRWIANDKRQWVPQFWSNHWKALTPKSYTAYLGNMERAISHVPCELTFPVRKQWEGLLTSLSEMSMNMTWFSGTASLCVMWTPWVSESTSIGDVHALAGRCSVTLSCMRTSTPAFMAPYIALEILPDICQ